MSTIVTVTDPKTVISVVEDTVDVSITSQTVEIAESVAGPQGGQGPAPVLTSSVATGTTIGTGSKTFTVASGLSLSAGQYVRVADAANPLRYMGGPITSYSGTSMIVNVQETSGSGALGAGTITITGARGAAGASGVIGVDAGELTNTGTSSVAQLGLATAGTAGTYTKVTTDEFGRVTSGTTLVLGDLPSGVALTGSANAFTVGGHTITNTDTSTTSLLITAANGQTATNLQINNNSGSRIFEVGSNGYVVTSSGMRASGGFLSGSISGISGVTSSFFATAANNIPIAIRGAASQTADLQQWQDSAGSILARVDSAGVIRGNRRAIFTSAAGTDIPLVAQGNPSLSVNLQEWQTYVGTPVATMNGSGVFRASIVQGGSGAENDFRVLNSGGLYTIKKATAAATNPGAGYARIYLRDGTNVNTMKLVVRAGATGAETTILDNIPT